MRDRKQGDRVSPNERTQPPPPGSGPTVEHEQTIEGRAPQPKPTRRAAVGWSAWFGLPRALAFSLPVEPRQPVRAILCKVRRTSAASAPRARVPCPGTPPAPANERYSAKPNRAAHIATTHMQALRRTTWITDRRWKRALAANPTSEGLVAWELQRGAAVRVHPLVGHERHGSILVLKNHSVLKSARFRLRTSPRSSSVILGKKW